MPQTNNDYLELPQKLWNVYRDASDSIFHLTPQGNAVPLTSEENATVLAAWQACQVRSGNASWDAEPCERCGQAVCICSANPEGSFCLPPEE